MTTNYKKIYVGDTKLDKKMINKLIGIEEDYQAKRIIKQLIACMKSSWIKISVKLCSTNS